MPTRMDATTDQFSNSVCGMSALWSTYWSAFYCEYAEFSEMWHIFGIEKLKKFIHFWEFQEHNWIVGVRLVRASRFLFSISCCIVLLYLPRNSNWNCSVALSWTRFAELPQLCEIHKIKSIRSIKYRMQTKWIAALCLLWN